MKFAVCIKQIPVLSRIEFDSETRTLKREGVPSEVSSFDLRALLKAVELRDTHGGEVVVLTMGPPSAAAALEYCLALGADRAVHLADRAFAGADTLATARTLTAALRRETPDLILFGRHSLDAETGQVGGEVAELLGLPQAAVARSLELDPQTRILRAQCELDDGFCDVELALPAIVTAAEDLAEERFPSKAERETAKTKGILTLGCHDLDGNADDFGSAGSPTWVAGLEAQAESRRGRIVEGATPAAAAAHLAEILVNDVRIFDGWSEPAASSRIAADAAVERALPRAIWVVAEPAADGLHPVTFELLGRAHELAQAASGSVAVVVLGAVAPELDRILAMHGAGLVLSHADAAAWANDPSAAARILDATIRRDGPGVVLFGATSWGREVAPRLAARLQLGLTSDCIGLEWDEAGRLRQLKPAFGGSIVAPILSRTIPEMATVRPGIFARREFAATVPASATLEMPEALVASRRILRWERTASGASELDHAEVVLGVGMGLGGPQALASLEPLQALLGASLCATRDVTDAGWMPRQYQVGLTGRAIAPRLYIGIGIRGAFEHTVGLRRAGCIVVINKNAKALAFKSADYGIVGDHAEVIPALVQALTALRAA